MFRFSGSFPKPRIWERSKLTEKAFLLPGQRLRDVGDRIMRSVFCADSIAPRRGQAGF